MNIFVLVRAAVARRFDKRIEDEQEILSNIMGYIRAMESGLLRAMKSVAAAGEKKSTLKIDMARVYINDAMALIENNARQIMAAMETREGADGSVSVAAETHQHRAGQHGGGAPAHRLHDNRC